MQIIVDQINNLESEYQELSDEELSSSERNLEH